MVGPPGALPVPPAAGSNDSDAADEFEHRARQHQDRAARHLSPRQRQARPALPFQLRLALQLPLPARHPDRAPSLRLRKNGTPSVPDHHRRMSERDNQVYLCMPMSRVAPRRPDSRSSPNASSPAMILMLQPGWPGGPHSGPVGALAHQGASRHAVREGSVGSSSDRIQLMMISCSPGSACGLGLPLSHHTMRWRSEPACFLSSSAMRRSSALVTTGCLGVMARASSLTARRRAARRDRGRSASGARPDPAPRGSMPAAARVASISAQSWTCSSAMLERDHATVAADLVGQPVEATR